MRNWYLISWVLTLAIGQLQFGYTMGELNLLQGSIKGIHSSEVSKKNLYIANTMAPLGAAVGAFLTGILSYYGRRKWVIIANVLNIIGTIFNAIGLIETIIIGRLISGVGIGIFSVIIPIFIIEISPLRSKGSYGTVNQLSITIGIFMSFLLK